MAMKREEKKSIQEANEALGNDWIDVDFQVLMTKNLIEKKRSKPHIPSLGMNIYVCVRKRPIFEKEIKDGQIDCVSSANPVIRVGEPKFKVDGITKYIENHDHVFDNVFGSESTTEELY